MTSSGDFPMKIHYAESFQRIQLSQGKLITEVVFRFLCGAEDGDGDTLRKGVTCVDCLRRLRQRPLK